MGVGREPGDVLAFLWFVIQNLPWSLRSPTPSQGLVWLEWSQWAAGRVAGSGQAEQQFLNALLPCGTESAFKSAGAFKYFMQRRRENL